MRLWTVLAKRAEDATMRTIILFLAALVASSQASVLGPAPAARLATGKFKYRSCASSMLRPIKSRTRIINNAVTLAACTAVFLPRPKSVAPKDGGHAHSMSHSASSSSSHTASTAAQPHLLLPAEPHDVDTTERQWSGRLEAFTLVGLYRALSSPHWLAN